MKKMLVLCTAIGLVACDQKPKDAPAPAPAAAQTPATTQAPAPAAAAQPAAPVPTAQQKPANFGITTNDPSIDAVKALKLPNVNPNITVHDAFDTRNMCGSVNWAAKPDNSPGGENKKLVLYKCNLANYQDAFKTAINKLPNKEGVEIPTSIAQTVLFSYSSDKTSLTRCRIAYTLPGKDKRYIEHPYCINLAYDKTYTESWNDVVESIVNKQVGKK